MNRVDGEHFEINIVPHTLQETIIGSYASSTTVNLEVDVIARYLERLIQYGSIEQVANSASNITESYLAENGFGRKG